MGKLFDLLKKDVRFEEGLKACINCGTCTAICPAAEFYNYDPRQLADIVQGRNDEEIETLLKSDVIWYCGECMSCKTRCPRGNAPGLMIIAMRSLAQDLGYFAESEKGRQQLAVKRTVGEWSMNHGYCVYPEFVKAELHPEQGPVWKWELENFETVMKRLGANPGGDEGALRKIPQEALDELKSIFTVTGALERFEKIESFSKEKAKEMGLELKDGLESEYFAHIYKTNSGKHNLDSEV